MGGYVVAQNRLTFRPADNNNKEAADVVILCITELMKQYKGGGSGYCRVLSEVVRTKCCHTTDACGM